MYYADMLTINRTYIIDEVKIMPDIGGYYNKDINVREQKARQILG